ncbi:MAG: hypothetical protein J6A21_10035, partial [Lentisphaeria bacterium]|nr:hypothetical protein [Lentisphaeria bacterium]
PGSKKNIKKPRVPSLPDSRWNLENEFKKKVPGPAIFEEESAQGKIKKPNTPCVYTRGPTKNLPRKHKEVPGKISVQCTTILPVKLQCISWQTTFTWSVSGIFAEIHGIKEHRPSRP